MVRAWPRARGRHPAKARTRRNVSVRAEDGEVWKRADEYAGDSLSQLVADLPRKYVAQHDGQAGGLERIVLEVVVKGDAPPGPWEKGDIRKVAFYGRWLVGDPVKRKNPIPGVTEMAVSDGDMNLYGVALTKGGKIAVLELNIAEGSEYGEPPFPKLYDSLEASDN